MRCLKGGESGQWKRETRELRVERAGRRRLRGRAGLGPRVRVGWGGAVEGSRVEWTGSCTSQGPAALWYPTLENYQGYGRNVCSHRKSGGEGVGYPC